VYGRCLRNAAAVHDQPGDPDDDHGADDGHDDRLEVDDVAAFAAAPEAQGVGHEAADECADDAQHDGSENAQSLVARHDQTGQPTGNGSQDDPRDNVYD